MKPATSPWQEPRGIQAVVESWLASNYVKPCFTADEHIAPRPSRTVAFPAGLPRPLAKALEERQIRELYTHQARAFEATEKKRRAVVISTPTASGKSYCFHLPVLKALLEDENARAMYLFPTKALSRDQEANLRKLMQDAGVPQGAIVYDGDTPGDARRAAREKSGIVLTNPDMLHAGILPHHTSWARTFQNLKYIVVDEMHVYRGVFGSHVANVLRRLLRVAAFHGSAPTLIGATATIGNPLAHAAALFGLAEDDVELIGESGAPAGPRRFFSFNPPVVNAELGVRASYVKQAVHLAKDLVKARVPTIIFGQSRNNVEMMLRYLREAVSSEVPKDRIQGYRGGYLPGQRREIEEKLRSGEILCVVATNALELGIDIGELDAVICAGYPGSVAALWQRFGRAGRRSEESIAVLVTSSAPLDQYLAREPKFVLGAPVEEARIDPSNVEILVQHLKCAAFELSFEKDAPFGTLPAKETTEALAYLAHNGVLHEQNGRFHWATDSYPANNVSLRSVGWDNVVIVDVEHDKTLAEIDWRGAHTMVHEQAIYQHDGETWQVEKFDYENHKAFVRKVEPDYFTDAMTYVQISVLDESESNGVRPDDGDKPRMGWGEVAVVEKVVGYKKVKFFTHENAGYGEVHLPEMQMHTTAFWLTVPEGWCADVPGGKASAVDALRGLGRALETVSTFALMCDPRDIGATLGNTPEGEDVPRKVHGEPRYNPTLFLYEHTPSGIGLVNRIFENNAFLLERAFELVKGCACTSGCPACVGPTEGGAGHGLKENVVTLLNRILAS
ncbi:MAG: DEAD/DEAH box helicase [Polyangiaceae bacterium]